jgi:hypothetical protein
MERSSITQPPGSREHSTGELVTMMSEQVSVLIRDELKLAQLEMTGKGRLRKATPPVPAQAVADVKADVEEIKERAQR